MPPQHLPSISWNSPFLSSTLYSEKRCSWVKTIKKITLSSLIPLSFVHWIYCSVLLLTADTPPKPQNSTGTKYKSFIYMPWNESPCWRPKAASVRSGGQRNFTNNYVPSCWGPSPLWEESSISGPFLKTINK